jgi:hypothetical protein
MVNDSGGNTHRHNKQAFYTQPTQATPGQFQHPPYNNFPPPRRQSGICQSYKSLTSKEKYPSDAARSWLCFSFSLLLVLLLEVSILQHNQRPHPRHHLSKQLYLSVQQSPIYLQPPLLRLPISLQDSNELDNLQLFIVAKLSSSLVSFTCFF